MPRPPTPGTRERILGTASRLFYAHGVRGVGMNRIITEAGTGKNLLYAHFPTKDDLVAAYLERTRTWRAESARRALDEAGEDPRDQLVAVVADVARIADRPDFRGCAFRNFLAEFPDDEAPAPTAVARAQLAESRATIERLVDRLGVADPADLAEQLWLLVDGLYVQGAYRDRDERRRGAVAAVELARRLVAEA
ncbi:TetR/AcrR family transcriptional regulator [Actinomycetospora corticicola]|uniref:AcrR family transcriptional regulator n=1 Tax=Actinomycetospora corticicola TaxID=663602 RepID=A0A7Y9DXT6_9PSEU|nr:TetR/AcrR family transcriptional regulator [Actinomycetospora corticicola]NYD37172.1 AcrR family transcriptional regulator [Actinomycetospora corticicola]